MDGFLVIPIKDPVDINSIPEGIRTLAKRSADMWDEAAKEYARQRIEKLREEIKKLQCEIDMNTQAANCIIPEPIMVEEYACYLPCRQDYKENDE